MTTVIESTQAVRAMKYCPVTGNIPLKCTESAFTKRCQHERRQKVSSGYPKHPYCEVCGGKVPDNVKFIEITDKEFKVTTELCEQCNREARLQTSHGKRVCASCQVIRSAVVNRPGVVVDTLSEFGQLPITELSETSDDLHLEPDDRMFLSSLSWKMAKSMATREFVDVTWEDIELVRSLSER